jgi:hypothetical protein
LVPLAIVFVHGIGNRPGPRYDRAVRMRSRYFRRFLLPTLGYADGKGEIRNPYWGDRFTLRWGGASIQVPDGERLGPGAGNGAGNGAGTGSEVTAGLILAGHEDPDRILVDVARRDLADAIDLLYTLLLDNLPDDKLDELVSEAADLVAYVAAQPVPRPGTPAVAQHPWLADVRTNAEFVRELWARALPPARPDRQTLGGGRRPGPVIALLGEGIRAARLAVLGQHTERATTIMRQLLVRPVSALLGDVFGYLATRGSRDAPGPVVQVVLDELLAARAAAPEGPLVVVAHSMGASIAYDVLSHFRPDLTVDVLVTVGAQVGLFEELGLFLARDPAVPAPDRPRAPAPPGVRHWINVVDRADPLGYRAEPIFDTVVDYTYPSAALWAHSAYFRQPHFHRRLAERVGEALA